MIYDYEQNIKIEMNEKGEIVMTMNMPIFTRLTNDIMQAVEYQKEHDFNATSRDTLKMWEAITDKSDKYYE